MVVEMILVVLGSDNGGGDVVSDRGGSGTLVVIAVYW